MGDKETARAGLNLLLREVVLATQACEHADCFFTTVPVDQIADYHTFVDPRNATVCLEQILSRVRSCYYSSVHEFRREYELLLANALAYNSPGHGQHAYKPIISWAQALLDICMTELTARQSDLAAFEQRLKDALTVGDSRTGKDSGQGSPRSQKTSVTVCPLSSMEALVAACEMAAEQEGFVEDDMLHYYMDVMGSGNGDTATGEEGMGEHGSGSGSGSQFGLDSDQQQPRIKREASGAEACAPPAAARGKGGAARNAPATYDAAPKYRRHKSKVYIRPNKVVYLPTTFMEENFDPASLPVNCEMIVETDSGVQPDRHRVTIKAVPRQGLATMYCMTNVMKFQQQFLNWQILNWTKMDDKHIKIHLQSPNGCSKGKGGESDDADVAPVAAPRNESHKRKGNSRSRDVYGSGACATNDEEADDAMDVDHARTQAEGANQQPRQRKGASTAGSPRCARGGHGRRTSASASVAARAIAVPDSNQGMGTERDGSGSSSPSHHDNPHLDVAMRQAEGEGAERRDAVSSGSVEEAQCERDAGSGGAGAVQLSHELQLSPAHSSGGDSVGATQQPLAAHAAELAAQQQQQQQQGMSLVQQQQLPGLQLPFPQAMAFGPAGFRFSGLPLWGLPGPTGATTLPNATTTPFDDAQQQYQRYAAAMMLLQQLPGAGVPSSAPSSNTLPGLGLNVAPLRTAPPPSLLSAASMPAGTDVCGFSHTLVPPASYKRCKTSSGSSTDTVTAAGTPLASSAGMLLPGTAGIDFNCLSLPALGPNAAAISAAMAAASASNAAGMACSKRPTDMGVVLPVAPLQHAMTL